MKILQINIVYGEKSTGRTCLEVEKAVVSSDNQCVTAYGYGKKRDSENCYRIQSKFSYAVHKILSRVTGLEGHFSVIPTLRLIRFMKKYHPDVVHLRNLHGHYLCLPILFNYLKKSKIPVVQNLHDCWSYTGHCVYYSEAQCEKWKAECHNCPLLKHYPGSMFFDTSRVMFNKKKKWYSQLSSLTVVGVSDWVTDEGRASFLAETGNVMRIHNWINQDVFKIYDVDSAETRNKYNIPTDKFIIIGVSALWSAGTPRFEDFMKLADLITDDMKIVMIGRACSPIEHKKIIHIPFIGDTTELAKLYNSADVYVHFSIEDTFGKVIAEAQACGLPVVVYDATACSEIVAENCGYVVAPRDVQDVFTKIQLIHEKGKQCFSAYCVDNVKNRFNYKNNVLQLVNLYEKLAAKGRN